MKNKMYDPYTVAHEIYSPFKDKKGCKKSLITIWHVDPEKDGTDDSCGWFIRARHTNQTILEKIKREFLYNWERNYWFDVDGTPLFSTIGMVFLMYRTALWEHYNRDNRKVDKFLKSHAMEIIHFAENPVDCIGDTITSRWGQIKEDNILNLGGTVYSDILRKERKWWQHPRWHLHHWKIQFHFPKRRKKVNHNVDKNLRATV